MRSFTWFDVALDIAAGISELALQWLVQSTLIIAIGLAVAILLRRGTPALRSVVYRTTLVAALVCPLLAFWLTWAGLTFVVIKLPSARLERLELVAAPTEPVPQVTPADLDPGGSARELAASELSELAPSDASLTDRVVPDIGESPAPQVSLPATTVDAQVTTVAPIALSPAAVPTTLIERRTVSIRRTLAVVFFGVTAVWGLVTLGLLVRLVTDHRRLARLRKLAAPVDEATRQVGRSVAERLQVSLPELKRTPFVASPCLSGVFRPVILLPEDICSEALSPVMIHELAHLKRGDCFWNFLSYLSVAVLWPQPLLWRLVRRIESAAEDVCDDYVLQHGESRAAYAEALLTIAERNLMPASGAAVSLLTIRSLLGQRIERILDTTRGLRLTAGMAAVMLVAAGGTSAALVAGMLGPAPEREESESASIVETARDDVAGNAKVEPPAKVAENADRSEKADDEKRMTVHGVVLDPDGKPVNGVDLYAAWTLVRNLNGRLTPFETKIVVQGKSDDQGRFELTFSTNNPDPPQLTLGWYIAAFAPGWGPAWQTDQQVRQNVDAKHPTTLKLAAEQVVQGRIVDLEGNPVSGVHIRLRNLHRPESNDALLDWLAEAREKSPPADVNDYFNEGTFTTQPAKSRYAGAYPAVWRDRLLHHGSPALPADTLTDENGRFQLPGLGSDQLAIVEIEGTQITKCHAYVVVRDMEPTSAKPLEATGVRAGTYFGKQFQFVAEPTQPIAGTVTDAESGEPLANVEVRISQLSGSRFSQQDFLTTRTDQQGNYTLIGAPSGGEHRVEVNPSLDEPYFPTTKNLAKSTGIDPLQLDFSLHRGQWIVGKVTDEDTGGPINDANVEYLPLRDNAFAKDYPNYRPEVGGHTPSERYRSSDDGSFRVLAIPGPGILAAIARNEDRKLYCCLNSDLVPPHLVQEDGNLNTYHPWTVTGYHALREVELAKSADDTAVDLRLTKGLTRTVHLVDSQGRPVKGVQVLSRNAPPSLEGPIDDSTVTIIGLRPNSSREVVFIQADRHLGKAVAVTPGDEMTVALEPCAAVRGRVVDEAGRPVAELPISVTVDMTVNPRDQWHRPLVGTTTDKEGHFEALLPPETTCRVSHYSKTGSDFSAVCRGSAGAIFELGDLTDKTKLDESQTDKLLVTAGDDEKLSAAPTEPMPQADEIETPATVSSDARSVERVEFGGKVVDPTGNAVAGAELYLVFHVPQPTGLLLPTWEPVARTDSAGAFHFTASAEDQQSRFAALIAVKDGFGFAWSQAAKYQTAGPSLSETHQRTTGDVVPPLKLTADDEPIRGRILDINGQPISGARLTLMEVWASADGKLDAWRAAAKEPKADYYSARTKTIWMMNGPHVRSLVKPAVTGADGNFTLHGVGRERIAELLLEGVGVETAKIFARTEPGEKIELVRERRSPNLGTYIYYPADFVYIAGPSATITGVIRDGITNSPLAGVTVKSQERHGEAINGWGQDFVRAVTDEAGRYRLEGMPIGSDNRIAAIAPRGAVPYLSRSKSAPTSNPARPVEVDFDLARGVWIEGRAVDGRTGKGLRGTLAYYASKDNPSYPSARSMNVDERDILRPDNEGRFQFAALPGPGFVAFMAQDHETYQRADAIVKLDGRREKIGRTMLETGPSSLMPMNYHIVAEVNPPPNVERVELNLELDSGNRVSGRVVDPEGKPLTGFYYSGQMAQFSNWTRSTDGSFELSGYDPETPRHVYFCHNERNLAGSMIVSGNSPENLLVKLQPAGKVTGRLVDEDGAAIGGCQLVPWSPPLSNPNDFVVNTFHAAPLPRNLAHWTNGQYETDESGRFEISCLAPGVNYRLRAYEAAGMSGGSRISRVSGPLEVIIRVEPGESKNLGDVRLADETKFALDAQQAPAEAAAAVKSQTAVSGRVTLPSGEPASGAHVAAIAMAMQPTRGGEFPPQGKVLAEAISDAQGNYRLTFTSAAQTHRNARLIARKDGFAIAWQALGLDASQTDASLALAAEQPIRGRLVDIEGQPAYGVKLTIRSIMKAADNGVPSSYGVGYVGDDTPRAWVPGVASDEDGRFAIAGVPSGHGVFLDVAGSEQFAPQSILLNTGMPEQRGERDATYRALVKNAAPGEEPVLPLAPSQLFEGLVTYEDTGEPAGLARLTIWASQQEEFGSMSSVAGKADKDGRYRISPHPGVRFGVTAYPSDGTPYLARQTPLSPAIRWQAGDRVKQVDMKLRRGVLVRGTVVEAESGAPVSNASIQYIPERSNNPNTSDDILTGWGAIEVTDAAGKFAIAVLPGPGRLLVHGPQGKYILRETSDQELSRGKPGGRRNYAHAIERIEPAAGADPLDLTISIEPGVTIGGSIVGEEGQPIDAAIVVSRLFITPSSPFFRGYEPAPTLGGNFELTGLDPKQEYNICFLDPKRRLGATQVLRADNAGAKVVLKPCGQATARFIDADGQPHVGFSPGLHMIVTPGVHEHDWSAAKLGKLAADADFVSNFDSTNYWPGPKTDEQGRLTFEALIPGAIYRLSTYKDGKPIVLKEFSVGPGEQIDLGEHAIDLN